MAKVSVPPHPAAPVPATIPAKAPGRGSVTFSAGAPGAAKKRRRPLTLGRVVNGKGLAVFTRQLATLVKAGMPILRSLEVLARQEKRPAFKEVIENIADTIRSGGNFSDGLAANEKIFDRLYINMVKAGEAGGVLDTVLERVAVFMEKAQRIAGKVKSAMIYPIIIVFVASAIVSVLMIFVVPTFKNIFRDMLKGQPLPALTEGLLTVSNFLKDHYPVALGGLAVVYVLFRLARKTRLGARVFDWMIIHVPILGDLFLRAAIARFTRTFGTLLASGVPILQALIITRDTSGNVHIANAINVVHDRVKEGDNVAKPLESTHIFPGMVTSMIEVGEETGALPEMLTRIADTYDEEVDTAVAGLTSIIEPIMIVFMAVVVGTIVIALFLPMVSIIQHLPT
jgi:type IV pilus assembly protein PilC